MKLDPKEVQLAIRTAETESDALLSLYRMVYPQWDDIESVDGWPQCNQNTWKAICREFQDLTTRLNRDRRYDKQVMPGGPWLNTGFTTASERATLADWEVVPAPVKLKEKATA